MKHVVEIETCDNPKCAKEFVTSDIDVALGYYIQGSYHLATGGGPIGQVFACSIRCIAGAVRAELER